MIAVYGATGYTGRLVARELRRRGLSATLSGRDQGKLDAVVREVEADWPVRAASIDDPQALREAFLGADAVINCAGPFTYYGAPVIEAALDVGAHYCDTTGEQAYMRRVFEHVDGPARRRGRAVVPAAGFDYVPGDLIAALAARGREPLRELVVAYRVEGFGATRGTIHSALEILGDDELVYRDGSWQPAGRPPLTARFDFGAPVGRRPVARYPGGEVVTVPRHVRTRHLTEWIAADSFAPDPRLAAAVPPATAAFALALRTPLRGLVHAVVDRLPEGPDAHAREATQFTIVAEAHGEDGTVGRGVVRGNDVYGLTAVIAVELARRMTDAAFDRAGALAPAHVVDPEAFLGFLGEHGVGFEVASPAGERTPPPARA